MNNFELRPTVFYEKKDHYRFFINGYKRINKYKNRDIF